MQASEELQALRQHREWADERIKQLIRRASEAERSAKVEGLRLEARAKVLQVRVAWRDAARVATSELTRCAAPCSACPKTDAPVPSFAPCPLQSPA